MFEPVLTVKQKLPKLAGIAEVGPATEAGLELAAQAEDTRTKKAKSARRRSAPKKKARKV